MQETTRLGNLIFSHWQKYQPRMVEELSRQNLLEEALRKAETLAVDLLYECLTARKLTFQEAWETAMQTCLLPEEQN